MNVNVRVSVWVWVVCIKINNTICMMNEYALLTWTALVCNFNEFGRLRAWIVVHCSWRCQKFTMSLLLASFHHNLQQCILKRKWKRKRKKLFDVRKKNYIKKIKGKSRISGNILNKLRMYRFFFIKREMLLSIEPERQSRRATKTHTHTRRK